MTITRTIRMAWHEMLCPSCFTDDGLNVTFTGTCHLTFSGSEDVGDHEWGDASMCRCTNCGFTAPVIAFRYWSASEGEDMTIIEEDADGEEEQPCTFEIQVSAMATDPDTGDQRLAQSFEPSVPIEFYDVELKRLRPSTGEIDVLIEHEELKEDEANRAAESLEERFPFADSEWI